MNKNYYPMDDSYGNNFGDSNSFISYPENNRYNNAYGNYRGGYDRSNQGPPLGFGPIGPICPPGPPGPSGPPGPPGHFGPPFPMPGDVRWKRGYSGPSGNIFRGPRKDKIIKFLLRCGIPREHVINIPNAVLSMMQPMNCGVCSLTFDSIDLSRIHYASKNHLKNQKKWVNQRSDSGTQHSKEPLKSRELYCELCDVHITSTGHADSHYAGKPHRAIVEGRKNPRNPFLMQPNKQGRLNALIRRELKFLKKLDALPAVKKPNPDAKPGSSELFCSICKTSMMCSEQMTTHLNGKRHLNKEKHHILRLMKGEVTDDKKDNASTENTEKNVDQADAMEGYDEEEEEDFADEDEGEGEEENGVKGSGGEKEGGAAAGVDDDDWGEGGEDWKPTAEDY